MRIQRFRLAGETTTTPLRINFLREPGDLHDLPPAGRAAWHATLVAALTDGETPPPTRLRLAPDGATSHLLATDWTGLPNRVVACAGRAAALELLDAPARGGTGGRALQEEYVEWRAVRDGDGVLRRVDLTTELPEYWLALVAHAPERCLALIAGFAGEPHVDPAAVFGACDPFDPATTSGARATAFADTMLAGGSPYNNGAKAITCMVQPSNTVGALAQLMRAALRTCTTTGADGAALRCLSAAEVLPLMRGLAVPARASDPLLVERLTRLAWDGRLVAPDDPLGVYMRGIEHTRLRTPAGAVVPRAWFRFGRGAPASDLPGGGPRFQRLTVEVPADAGFALGDLVDVATEEPIRFGGQIAELLQLSVYLRVSDAGVAPPEPLAMTAAAALEDATAAVSAIDGCADVRRLLRERAG